MAFPLLAAVAPALISAISNVVDKAVPDKDLNVKLKHELEQQLIPAVTEQMNAARDVIVAEAKSEHPLTAQWRPITMLTFTAIVANNYILYPYLSLFWPEAPVLELPQQMWQLLTVGVGGYIGGRSLEKFAKNWKG